jgi:hypothetical protein
VDGDVNKVLATPGKDALIHKESGSYQAQEAWMHTPVAHPPGDPKTALRRSTHAPFHRHQPRRPLANPILGEESASAEAAEKYADYKIIRRNGSVVGFEPDKIAVAMTKRSWRCRVRARRQAPACARR